MKRSKRVDAARSEAAPVAGSWTQTAAGRVVPLAQTAAAMAVPLAQNAAAKAGPLAQSVAGMAVPLAQGAVAKAGPLAQTAAAAAVPLATQAVAAVSPYAHTVAERVSPYTDRAAERLAPLAAGAAHSAAERVGPVLSEAYGKVGEAYAKLGEAYSQVGPALGSAREHVTEDLLPKMTTAIGTAAGSPIAVEAVRRGRATVAAARGELSLPEPAPVKSGSWVKRAAVLAGVAGVVALVARQVLGGSKDSGWQAARPSAPSAPSAPTTSGTATASSTTTTTTPVSRGTDTPVDDLEVGDVPEPVLGSTQAGTYGEGSYVGSEPPEGFVIKGNENSMKYHVPDGSGYHSTQAEVWFSSEEAAERAGFVRAQE